MANQIRVSLWVGIVAFWLLQGCQPKTEEFIIGLEPEFDIELQEALGPAPRSLQLVIKSISAAPCLGSSLLYTWKVDEEGASLYITGYTLPEVCVQPATAISATENTSWTTEGKYSLHCSLRGIGTNPGIILSTPSFYSLDLPHNAGFTSKEPLTFKLPEKCFWGTIATSDESQWHLIQAFLNSYKMVYPALTLGNYGHFTISEQQIANLDASLVTPLKKGSDFAWIGEPDSSFLSAMRTIIDGSAGTVEGYIWTPEGILSF